MTENGYVLDEILEASKSLGDIETVRPDAEREASMYETYLQHLRLESFRQDITERFLCGRLVLGFLAIWSVVILRLLFMCGSREYYLSDKVLITLLGTTTVQVIGLAVIVVRYLFPNKIQ